MVFLLMSIEARQQNDFYDEDIVKLLRRYFFQRNYDNDFSFTKRKTEAGLQNPEILKICQDECAHLRVSSTDDALRQPYKTCRDDCVNRRLGLS